MLTNAAKPQRRRPAMKPRVKIQPKKLSFEMDIAYLMNLEAAGKLEPYMPSKAQVIPFPLRLAENEVNKATEASR